MKVEKFKKTHIQYLKIELNVILNVQIELKISQIC